MIKTLFWIICIGLTTGADAQIDQERSGITSCEQTLDQLQNQIYNLKNKYIRDRNEFLQGRFCSDCLRSASQIEEEDHISFEAHIALGAADGRHVVRATQAQLDQLYNRYVANTNNLVSQYQTQANQCNLMINQYNQDVKTAQQEKSKEALEAARQRFLQQEAERRERLKAAIDNMENSIRSLQAENAMANRQLDDQLAKAQETNKLVAGAVNNADQYSFDNADMTTPVLSAFFTTSGDLVKDDLMQAVKDEYLGEPTSQLLGSYGTITEVSDFLRAPDADMIVTKAADQAFDAESGNAPVINQIEKTTGKYISNFTTATTATLNNIGAQVSNFSNVNDISSSDNDFSNQVFNSNTQFADNPGNSAYWAGMKKQSATVLIGGIAIIVGAPAIPIIVGAAIYNLW